MDINNSNTLYRNGKNSYGFYKLWQWQQISVSNAIYHLYINKKQ